MNSYERIQVIRAHLKDSVDIEYLQGSSDKWRPLRYGDSNFHHFILTAGIRIKPPEPRKIWLNYYADDFVSRGYATEDSARRWATGRAIRVAVPFIEVIDTTEASNTPDTDT